MKTYILALICAAGLTATAQAQIFRPQTAANVLIGGVAGAIIGDHNNHHAAEGALIGAAAGYIWSEATTPACQPAYAPPLPVAYGYGRTAIVRSSCGYAAPAPRRVVYVARAPVYYGPHYYVNRDHYQHRW